MQESMFQTLILGLLTLVLGSGCAGHKEFKTGSALLQNNQCDQAIAPLVRAVDLARPKSQSLPAHQLAENYRQTGTLPGPGGLNRAIITLNQALECAADASYQSALAAHQQGDLAKAHRYTGDSLDWVPQHRQAAQLLEQLDQEIARSESMLHEANELTQQSRWHEALAQIQRAQQINRSLSGGRDALLRTQQGGYHFYHQAALAALETDDRSGALAQLEIAEQFKTDADCRHQLTTTIDNRNRADALCQTAGEFQARADWQKALELYLDAQTLFPERPGLGDAIHQSKLELCRRHRDTARQCLVQERYLEALAAVRQGQTLLPGFEDSAELEETACERLYEQHMTRARAFAARNLPGNGCFQAALALGYRADPAGEAWLAETARQLKESTACQIGLEFHSVASPIEYLIRDHIEAALRATLPRTGRLTLLDPGAPRPAFDAIVSWQLLRNDIVSSQSERFAQSSYREGFIQVYNPDYDQLQRSLNLASLEYYDSRDRYRDVRDRYEHERRRFDTMTEEEKKEHVRKFGYIKKSRVDDCERDMNSKRWDYERARRDFASVPRWRQEEDTRSWTYPIVTHTKQADIEVSLTIMDTHTGQPLAQGLHHGHNQVQDDACTGDSARNVPHDPLNLPGDDEIARGAFDRLAASLHTAIRSAAGRYTDHYFAALDQARQSGNPEQTVEQTLRLWYFDDSPRATEAFNALQSAAGQPSLSDWQSILARYR